MLDILRNNARLEALYAMTAARAFQFCLTYKRTTEFRRLCDILRNHLANLNKYVPPAHMFHMQSQQNFLLTEKPPEQLLSAMCCESGLHTVNFSS